jgi:RimJ/RimL family protein N-acetyltransferase
LVDEQALQYFLAFYEGHPQTQGFGNWYVLLPGVQVSRPTCIGLAGFKGEPAADGSVEIGYSLLEEFQGRGYATEAVRGLVEWAFACPDVRRVIAETLPDLTPSIRVLEENHFEQVSGAAEPGAIRFERLRGQ